MLDSCVIPPKIGLGIGIQWFLGDPTQSTFRSMNIWISAIKAAGEVLAKTSCLSPVFIDMVISHGSKDRVSDHRSPAGSLCEGSAPLPGLMGFEGQCQQWAGCTFHWASLNYIFVQLHTYTYKIFYTYIYTYLVLYYSWISLDFFFNCWHHVNMG